MSLNYIAPVIVNGQCITELDKAEVAKESHNWKCALIEYVIGANPGYNGYNVMMQYINQNWKEVAQSELFMHEEGYFIVGFKSQAGLQDILCLGPYSINNRPFIPKP